MPTYRPKPISLGVSVTLPGGILDNNAMSISPQAAYNRTPALFLQLAEEMAKVVAKHNERLQTPVEQMTLQFDTHGEDDAYES